MSYLAAILGRFIGWIIYYFYQKKITKICPYCGERIKQKAILCRWCGKSLITPVEEFTHNVEKITQTVFEDNLKRMSAIISLSVTKKVLETQIFITQGVKLLGKNKKQKK